MCGLSNSLGPVNYSSKGIKSIPDLALVAEYGSGKRTCIVLIKSKVHSHIRANTNDEWIVVTPLSDILNDSTHFHL